MYRLISFFIHNRRIINMIIFFVLVLGAVTLTKTRREAFPSVSMNTFTVTTIYPGASPEDVELNVTIPLERELDGVAGIAWYTSASSENLSVITIQADPNLNKAALSTVQDDIKSAIDRVENLPQQLDGRPLLAEIKTENMPIIEIALSGNRTNLRPLALDLEKELKKVSGIGLISKVGYFDPEVHIELNPWLMKNNYISFEDVTGSIASRNIRASGGSLNSYTGRKTIVTISKFKHPTDVRNVILRSNFDRQRTTLQQVAAVKLTEKDERLMVRANGRVGISLVLTKKPEADLLNTIDRLRTFLEKRKWPEGVQWELVNDTSKMTRNRISILESNAIVGFLLVLGLLMVMLNSKSAFWTAFGLPFSILGAFAVLPFFGITINNVSLGGFLLVIGMLVDDAIVSAEYIEQLQEQGLPPAEAAAKGAAAMVKPITAAALTTVAGFLPMLFLGGKPGKFAWAIPIVVTITLLISLFDAFFLLPAHLAHGRKNRKKKKKKNARPRWLIKMENGYHRILTPVLRKKYWTVALIFLLLPLSLIIARRTLKMELFPSGGTDTFFIKFTAPVGSSLDRTASGVKKVEKLLTRLRKEHGEISSFTARIGHQHTGNATRNSGDHENHAIITVYLVPDNKRERSGAQIMQEVQKKLPGLNKTRVVFEIKKMGPDIGKPVELVITGNNDRSREQAVKRVWNFLEKIDGVYGIERDDLPGKPELSVNLDYRQLAAYGLTTKNVSDLLRIAYDGQRVSSLQTPEEEIWYRVILAPGFRRTPGVIKHLQARNRRGQLVPLQRLVSFTTQQSQAELRHYNGQRAITVSAQVNTDKITSGQVAKLINNRLLKRYSPPPGVTVSITGEAKETKNILGDAAIAAVIALFAIFFLISLVLNDSIQPLMLMTVIPLSLAGVLFTLIIHGVNASLFTIISVIGLAGVVINDAIVMTERLNSSFPESKPEAAEVAAAAKSRLRPIMLTTLTTVAGLLPTAYGIGGFDPMISPMALAMSWGLLFGSLITLFLIPAFFMVRQDIKYRKKPAQNKAAGGVAI